MVQEPITIQRLRQVRTVTKNYHMMRGLQGVPMGVFWLVVAMFELHWLSLPDQWMGVAEFAAFFGFLVALILYPLIGDYYDHLFGRLRPAKRNMFDRTIGTLGILVLFLTGMRIDNSLNLPISATGLVLAIWFFILWWRTDSFRTHLLVLGFFTLLVSLLPLLGFTFISKLFLPDQGGYALIIGLLLTVGGLCDHLILLRSFRPIQVGRECTL